MKKAPTPRPTSTALLRHLRKHCAEHNITPPKLSALTGYSPAQTARWLSGTCRGLRFDTEELLKMWLDEQENVPATPVPVVREIPRVNDPITEMRQEIDSLRAELLAAYREIHQLKAS